MGEQHFDHFAIAGLRCRMQSGPTALLGGIRVRAAFRAAVPLVAVCPSGYGRVQRSILHGVSRAGIDRRAAVEQRIARSACPKEGGQMKRCPAIAAVRFQQSGIAIDFCQNLCVWPADDRLENVEHRIRLEKIVGDFVLAVIFRQQERDWPASFVAFSKAGSSCERRSHARQIALLDLLLERCSRLSCLKPPEGKPCSVLFSSQSRWLM